MTEPTATLADLIDQIDRLRGVPPMGRIGRKVLLKLAEIADDLPTMTGLVLLGETHRITKVIDYAPCGCRDGRHTFSRDGSAWFGRGHWTTLDEAEKRAEKNQTHVVRRTVAYTDTKVVA